MATIITKVESARGCGYRKAGGLYMVGGSSFSPCGKLPIELDVCPCCNSGIKQSRSFSWITRELLDAKACNTPTCTKGCNAFGDTKRFGLLWVGTAFYNSPTDFTRESMAMGVSKRIAFIPKDLEVGKTWVLLAHPKAITEFTNDPENPVIYKKGIFSAFIPQRIEYVVKGTESEDELDAMEKRGITLVNVVRDTDAQLSLP